MLNAVIAALLLLLAALLLIAIDLRILRGQVPALLGLIGLIAVVLVVGALGVGLLAGGVTLFVAIAVLGAAVGCFIALWLAGQPQAARNY